MNVKIEKQNDGTYIAYNEDGGAFVLLGTGDTVTEAKEDFFDSIEEVKQTLAEEGSPIPDALSSTPSFKFDLSSLFEYYKVLNVSAFARFIGINDALMRQYKKGDTYISEKQLDKIEDGIHRLGNELATLKLV